MSEAHHLKHGTTSKMEIRKGKDPTGSLKKKTAADKMRDSTGSENSKEANLYDRVAEKVQAEMAT